MPPNFAPYGAARTALLQARARVAETPANAQALAAMAAAYDRLHQEEEPIRAVLDQAWDNNVSAVADANTAFREARQSMLTLEVQVGQAARARNPARPVVSDEELTELAAAEADVEAARAGVADAKQAFKAGVTVEQLEAVA